MPIHKKQKMYSKFCLVTAWIVFTFVSPTFALDSEPNRQTLRGLQGVRVLIEDLGPEIEAMGLTKNQLQTDVEAKLRKAGIEVLTQEECFRTPGEPYLYLNINLNTGKTGDDKCSYSIDIGVIQDVLLQRDPRQKTYAVTWSTGGVGTIEKESVIRLRDSVDDLVSVFMKAFMNANPKKK